MAAANAIGRTLLGRKATEDHGVPTLSSGPTSSRPSSASHKAGPPKRAASESSQSTEHLESQPRQLPALTQSESQKLGTTALTCLQELGMSVNEHTQEAHQQCATAAWNLYGQLILDLLEGAAYHSADED